MANETSSRREFMKSVAASAMIAGASSSILGKDRALGLSGPGGGDLTRVAPSDRIGLATIGVGGQGTGDTQIALRVPGVELVAVSDIYDGRLIRAKEVFGDHVFTTRDYREVLARPDVDAVIVATPDHWHMQASIDALAAGKHVYCEKPMVHAVEEGHKVINAQKKSGRVFQVGSQRVSSIVYEKAKELLAAGAIGELNLVEAWYDRNTAIGAWQYSIPPDASPANIDWDRFLGTAPKRPFEPIRLFRWRNYRDYGTGVAGDLYVHLFSGLHFITGSTGPDRVMTSGGLRFWKDGRDVPDVMLGLYDYPAAGALPPFNLTLRTDFADGATDEAEGFRFIGSEGEMSVGYGVSVRKRAKAREPGYTIGTFPRAVQDEFLKQYRAEYPPAPPALTPPILDETYYPPNDYNDSLSHFTNFFTAIRSNTPVIEDAVFGLRAAGPALLSNFSYFDKKPYRWDPATMKVSGSE
ncbi:MAG TPA: Gfo/Idh/MocA family oxidoreductase [Blastocatellia bacterium]